MSAYSIALVTVPDKKLAEKLSASLIKGKLAACVNIVPDISSVYRDKGGIEKSSESLLIIKTRSALIADLSEFVRQNHPYSTPEVIAVSIQDGLQKYLDWIGANTLFTKATLNNPSEEA